jgi:sensor histidine kinase YesM
MEKTFAFKNDWITYLKLCVVLNLAASVVSFSFTVSNGGWGKFNLQEFIVCFIFSNIIGPPIWYLIKDFSNRWQRVSFVKTILTLSILLFFITFLAEIIARFILRLLFDIPRYEAVFPNWQQLLFSLTMAFTSGFGLLFYEILQKKFRQKELDEQKAKTLAAEAQLASLESRIHPHFLFNTINSISALISENPVLAEEMMGNFSDLLRYSLDEHAKSLVSLRQELEITNKYLEIEKIRYEERLDFVIKCEKSLYSIKIPPLSLQTLVENSIKHVVAKSSEPTTITILVESTDDSIEVKVTDSGKGFTENDLKPNHGLDNLQKRLQNLFGAQASLRIGGKGVVKLLIPA